MRTSGAGARTGCGPRRRGRPRERSRRHRARRGSLRIPEESSSRARSDDGYDQRASAASWEGRREICNSASRRRKPQNAHVRRSTSANRQRDGGARRHRVPSQAPVTRKKDGAYNAEPAASVRARVSEGEIGIAISGEEREHATSLALARRMQRGGGHSSRDSARRRGHSSPRAAEPYQQKKNTRKRDEYLSLLLGKAPADETQAAAERSPQTSPGTVARAKQLEKELARRRRLLELEQGLGARIIARSDGADLGNDPGSPRSPRSRQMMAAANRREREQNARRARKGKGNSSNYSSAPPFDAEPVARRINRRKEMERRKIQDGNVNRLIRAVKSGIVELQLCVWEWQKEKTFKSKDVARTRRVSLRRKLHRLLEDHRRSVVELVAAVRNWQSERGMDAFLWNDIDIMDLLRRMPSLCGSSSDEAHDFVTGTLEAYESEFGLGFLGESDKVVGFLGFAVGDGDVVRRLDGTTDCNLFVLTPEDRIRAARLWAKTTAEHLARSLLYRASGIHGGEDDDDEDNPEDEQLPFSCPEDMPPCRLATGRANRRWPMPEFRHVGGDNWRELDAKAFCRGAGVV